MCPGYMRCHGYRPRVSSPGQETVYQLVRYERRLTPSPSGSGDTEPPWPIPPPSRRPPRSHSTSTTADIIRPDICTSMYPDVHYISRLILQSTSQLYLDDRHLPVISTATTAKTRTLVNDRVEIIHLHVLLLYNCCYNAIGRRH